MGKRKDLCSSHQQSPTDQQSRRPVKRNTRLTVHLSSAIFSFRWILNVSYNRKRNSSRPFFSVFSNVCVYIGFIYFKRKRRRMLMEFPILIPLHLQFSSRLFRLKSNVYMRIEHFWSFV
jgi:hypothetical protein